MEQRDRYIDYARTLRERVANKATQSGITIWALTGAVIYLIWQTIPTYAVIKGDADAAHLALFLTGQLLALMVGAWHLLHSLAKRNFYSPFDSRLERDISITDAVFVAAITILQVGFPAMVNAAAINSAYAIPSLYWLYRINAYGLGILLVVVLITLPILLTYKKVIGFVPLATNSVGKKGKLLLFASASVDLALIALAPVNIYGIYVTTKVIDASLFSAVFLTAFNTAIAIWALTMLMKSYRASNALAFFEKLERDIVMHGLSEAEIRDRLEQEYLGSELGAWIGKQVGLIKEYAADLNAYCASVNERIDEVRKVDATHTFERMGRLRSIINGLETRLDTLTGAWTPMQRWLTYSNLTARNDSYAETHIKAALNELVDLRARAAEAARESLRKVKVCAQEEG